MMTVPAPLLAERLYGRWRRWTEVHGASDSVPPRWDHLTTNQQAHWLEVADEAVHAFADDLETVLLGTQRVAIDVADPPRRDYLRIEMRPRDWVDDGRRAQD